LPGERVSFLLLSFTATNSVGSLAEFFVLFDAYTLNQDLLLEDH